MKTKKPTKAVILVGGEGTRLRPLTHTTVKAMMPVLNKPFLQHVLHHLSNHNIHRVILAMGYKPDSIRNYFDKVSDLDVELIYNTEQHPLGTAGAIKNAAQYFDSDDTFFVVNGDIFTDLDLSNMLDFHRNRNAKVTIALTPVDDPTQFGVVDIDDQQLITRFIEKPSRQEVTSNLINAGTYILEAEILKHIPKDTHFMFEHDVFPKLLADGEPVYGYTANTYWIDMGTPEKYLQLNHDLLLGKCSLISSQAESITTDKRCSIHPQAKFTGPIMIDRDCTIGKDAQLKGPSILGSGCNISDDAAIESSILWQNVYVGKQAIIKNCIIASDGYIENGVYFENSIITKNTTAKLTATKNPTTNTGG